MASRAAVQHIAHEAGHIAEHADAIGQAGAAKFEDVRALAALVAHLASELARLLEHADG